MENTNIQRTKMLKNIFIKLRISVIGSIVLMKGNTIVQPLRFFWLSF